MTAPTTAATIEKIPYADPTLFIQRWPTELPLLYFGGPYPWAFLALAGRTTTWEAISKAKINFPKTPSEPKIPFTGGYMGVLPYDYGGITTSNQEYPVAFEINHVLAFNRSSKTAYLCMKSQSRNDFQISPRKCLSLQPQLDLKDQAPGITLKTQCHDDDYLEAATKVIQQINQGRYYQLNLLRYFDVDLPLAADLLTRFHLSHNPMGMWYRWSNHELISFTPERLAQIRPKGSKLILTTQPIKGTCPASDDQKINTKLSKELASSIKDQAELNMIIDLLRNDMNTVSNKGTVQVTSTGTVNRFDTVLHRVATITSHLKENLSFGEFINALFPGGSITGAPKVEVMKAIWEFENRNRNFFMGSAFFFDQHQGSFDSNILIRTIHRNNTKMTYAAGSGIVSRSVPIAECNEIKNKCRVLENPIPSTIR